MGPNNLSGFRHYALDLVIICFTPSPKLDPWGEHIGKWYHISRTSAYSPPHTHPLILFLQKQFYLQGLYFSQSSLCPDSEHRGKKEEEDDRKQAITVGFWVIIFHFQPRDHFSPCWFSHMNNPKYTIHYYYMIFKNMVRESQSLLPNCDIPCLNKDFFFC